VARNAAGIVVIVDGEDAGEDAVPVGRDAVEAGTLDLGEESVAAHLGDQP
jgi:hypothetical protein